MARILEPTGLALVAAVLAAPASNATSFTLTDLTTTMRIETQRTGTLPAGVVDWRITRNNTTTDIMYEEGF